MEEDESAMPKKDARTLVARFNEQIEPIYALLRETEDVNLAYELLEPEPMEILALKQRWARGTELYVCDTDVVFSEFIKRIHGFVRTNHFILAFFITSEM